MVAHRTGSVLVFLLLRGLRFSFLLVTGFPAVGDLRQELADAFDVAVCPNVYGAFPGFNHLRGGYFTEPDMLA